MIALNHFSFDFGGRRLYDDSNFYLKEGEKVALVGKNGAGKSTFLRILTGEYSLSEGTYTKPKNLKIGFLNQDLQSFDSQSSIYEVALSAFEEQLKLRDEIEHIIQQLEKSTTEELVHLLDEKQTAFEAVGGYTMEFETKQMLAGLGFDESEQSKPYSSFSGGWRMRVMLVKILLQKPDLLLLDEPTNHLDLPSLMWLENYLLDFPGAFIIVSHDRYFLEKTTTRTVEISMQKFNDYAGNYSFFLREKIEREKIQQAAYENQQQFIKEQEKFIDRFKAKATKASQAQSKIKMLEKLEKLQPVESDNAQIDLRFKVKVTSGVNVLELKLKGKSYEDKNIFKESEICIRRGDKIGLIGANGLGKSTLLRILAQTENFDGSITLGHNVIPSFFAQHQLEALNLKNSILEELNEFVIEKGEPHVRTILGCFLFHGDDVHKKISILSGGEKSRVALAKTLMSDANFLLLDEPTNHLDMSSIEVLIQALQNYEGTYVVISHDRYFLEQVTNKIWYIEDKEVKEYPGTFSEYLDYQERKIAESGDKDLKTGKHKKAETKLKEGISKKQNLSFQDSKKLRNEIKKIEQTIEKLEKSLKDIDNQMLLPENISDFARYEKLQKDKSDLEDELFEWYEKLEAKKI